MTLSRRRLGAVLLAGLLVGTSTVPSTALAQFTVFDPTNYAQNLLQAARALETINNQIASLQNEAQMLIGQAKNLANLPFSSLAALQAQVDRTRALLSEAQGLAYDVSQIQAAFRTHYGPVDLSATEAAIAGRAETRWTTAVASFQDALKVQAGVVGGMGATRDQMSSLVSASQSAVGALQATQAGNQLLALQSQQLADLIALSAAQGRAQALEVADRAAARADAKARFARFIGGQDRP